MLDIVVNLDKPANMTSQQAVTLVKRALRVRKAGHAGTLDPIATGVLLVCTNEATKITRFLSELEKEYVCELKLGEKTDSCDSTGRVITQRDCSHVREEDLRRTLVNFTGDIRQTPPMFSAIKIGGERLYDLARRGISVERPERSVFVREIELVSYRPPYATLRVVCSKGTYVRALCDDIGEALGTGAHMTALTRTRVGRFCAEDAVTLSELSEKGRSAPFYSPDEALAHLKEIVLDGDAWKKARNGLAVHLADRERLALAGSQSESLHPFVRLKSPQRLLFGIAVLDDSTLKIERLLNPGG